VEMLMIKQQDGSFRPADSQSLELAAKIKAGVPTKHKVTKPRNIQFHRKYFSLLNLAFENQEQYGLFEAFRDAVTMQAGWYDSHTSFSGKLVFKPKSISFSKMDDMEFNELYNKTINVILKHVLTGSSRAELLNAVLNY